MTARQVLMLLSLAAIWGASFVFVRIAAPAFGPVVIADARVLLAGIGLWLYVLFTRQNPAFSKSWRAYLLLGLFNAALQFGFMAYAATHLSPSTTAIMVATMPLWSAPIATFWFGDQFSAREIFGLLLGIAGVSVVVGVEPRTINATFVLAAGAALLSALAGAIGGNYARHAFAGEDTMAQTIGQQLSAGLLLLPLAVFNPPSRWPSLPEASALLALALLSTGLAFLIYFQLIREIGVTRTLTVEFLVPAFAAIWGFVLIGETLSATTLFGGLMILFGCALVNSWRLPAFSSASR